MRKSQSSRILAFMLVFCMLFSLLPTVFATEPGTATQISTMAELEVGASYVIAANYNGAYYAMTSTNGSGSSNYMESSVVEVANASIADVPDGAVWTLEAGDAADTYRLVTPDGEQIEYGGTGTSVSLSGNGSDMTLTASGGLFQITITDTIGAASVRNIAMRDSNNLISFRGYAQSNSSLSDYTFALNLFKVDDSDPELIVVSDIQKYGNLVLSVSGSDLLARGYTYGDILTVSFHDKEYDMPLCTSYSDVDNGNMVCRVVINEDTGDDYVILAINMGDLATTSGIATKVTEGSSYTWNYNVGVVTPVEVTFEMKEAGGYYEEWLIRQLSRTNNREDYPLLTDAEFANFRNIATTGMNTDTLYRSSSPVNPELARNGYADAATELAGVKTIMNLADSDAIMQAYAGYEDTYYSTCNIIGLNLGVDFTAADFQEGLAAGLRFFIENEGPYLVHCNEGKDRAGFVSALLECLMGASAGEVISDYMVTYYNYYGAEPGTDQYNAIANSNIKKSLAAAFGVDDITAEDIDLAALAKSYMIDTLGLTSQEVSQLKENLGVPSTSVEILFLGTSDLHGQIYATDYTAAASASGTYSRGLTRIASYVKDQRSQYENVFLADSGDTIQGTPLTYYYAFEQQGADDPTVKALRTMGYDLWVIGNHEFNYGMDILQRQLDYATSPSTETESQVSISVANYLAADTNSDSSKDWATWNGYAPYTVYVYDGVRVAVMGIGNPNVPTWDIPANWEGIYFADVIETYLHYEAEMLENADLIVLYSHSGVNSSANSDFIEQLIQQTDSIDLVFSGHEHNNKVWEITNSAGETVPVIQPYTKARAIGQALITYDKATGEYTIDASVKNMENQPIDAELEAVLKPYEDATWNDYMLNKIGEASDNFSAANLGTSPSAFMDLINTVQLWGAYDRTGDNTPDNPDDDTMAQLSISAPLTSGSAENLIPKGDIMLGDMFRLYRYENWFYQITMSGMEVRTWLEFAATKIQVDENGDPYVTDADLTYYDVIFGDGFHYEIDYTAEPGNRIAVMKYNGVAVADDDQFTVVVNNYRFNGGGGYVAYLNANGCTFKANDESRVIYSTQFDMIQGEDLGQARNLLAAYIEEEGVISPTITSTWKLIEGQPFTNPFTDVIEGTFYYDAVLEMAELGIIRGMTETTFEPSGTLTRGQCATILYRVAGEPEVDGFSTFTDVATDRFYSKAIAWAQDTGVVNGVTETTFEPEGTVTREQLVAMMYRYEQAVPPTDDTVLDGFTDADSVSAYAEDAMAWAVDCGIIKGMTDTTLAPKDPLTRAQAATIIYRYLLLHETMEWQ